MGSWFERIRAELQVSLFPNVTINSFHIPTDGIGDRGIPGMLWSVVGDKVSLSLALRLRNSNTNQCHVIWNIVLVKYGALQFSLDAISLSAEYF